MKKYAQQVAIANSDGWTHVSVVINGFNHTGIEPPTGVLYTGKDPVYGHYQPLPEYTYDLNPIHKALRKLSNGQFELVLDALRDITGNSARTHEEELQELRAFHSASAAQWSEAYLKALHLWEYPANL